MNGTGRDLQAEIRQALIDPSIQEAVPTATRLAAMMRRQAVAAYPGYERARDQARAIKERAIEDLPALLERLEAAVQAVGGTVHRADDAEHACRIVVEIAAAEDVRVAVKSKSMTTEEIHLNAALEEAGVAVRETDLGEYIVQLAGDRPSHIVAPIIHLGLQQVRQVFGDALGLEEVPETAEELTQLARVQLRQEFLAADMGITGANFLLADSGTVVIVENEGNARLTTELPRVHVAVAGLEKVLPGIAELEPFLQLLPRSATGQLLTSYLSFITGPGWGASPLVQGERKFHLVLLDNGRLEMRQDPVLREALYCIRCGACLNVCAPYQAVGGHVFGGPTYQSGIGNAWEAGVRGLEVAAEFNELCTGCTRCQDVCPVRIDIAWMNEVIRQRIHARSGSDYGAAAALLQEPRRLYQLARKGAALRGLANLLPFRVVLEKVLELDRRRPLPKVASQTLTDWFAGQGGAVAAPRQPLVPADTEDAAERIVLFADCHTDHLDVQVGKATISVLQAMGFEVALASGFCCGRAALTQGNLEEAGRQARQALRVFEPIAEQGGQIVGIEPSCLTCLVKDHTKLLPSDTGPLMVGIASSDIMQFIERNLERLLVAFPETPGPQEADLSPAPRTVIVHGHCQQKTAGWYPSTLAVLGHLPGVQVQSTMAECCGMAGAFGYRPDGYEVSRELGQRLATEIAEIESMAGAAAETLACGTSCRAQLADFGDGPVRHPIELVADFISTGSPPTGNPRPARG